MISAQVKDYDIYYYELQDLVWRRTGSTESYSEYFSKAYNLQST